MKTLLEQVTGWMVSQRKKHDLGDNYEVDYVNNMNNYELLEAISNALAELMEKK